MNYRNILKVYKLERELSPDDIALLNTLRGMSDSERELFVEALQPEKPVKSSKPITKRKIEKCGVEGCGLTRRAVVHKDPTQAGYHVFNDPNGHAQVKAAGKSKRAESLAGKVRRPMFDLDGGVSKMRDNQPIQPTLCTYEIDDKVCRGNVNDGIHDKSMGYGNYHPFRSTAPPATQPSPTNGDDQSSLIETEIASGVSGD